MSFRGRSFRPRALNRPPRSRGGPPGIRGSFRFQAPESYAGRHASSSHDDYPVSERRSFEERDRFHRVRSPDEEFRARSHAPEYVDNDDPYSGGHSSYYGHRTNTIDYGHGGMKTVASGDVDHRKTDLWSSDPFTEQRRHSTERHRIADKPKVTPQETEVDHPSKVVAVEKAMEMAQRTREIISKIGGFKQTPQQSEGSSSLRDSSLQPTAVFYPPLKESSESNVTTAKAAAAESAAINKIRQNTSLVQYAFNLPVETEQTTESRSSLPSHDANSSWSDPERKFGGSIFETPVPDHSRETANYAVTNVKTSASYEDSTTAHSQQNTWNMAPKVPQEPAKTESCDPTIANILKSIGFNFELSNMMQDKAHKESSAVDQNNSAESSSHAKKVPSLYEEKANRYRAEQMRQYGTVHKPDNEESLHLHSAVETSATKSSLNVLQHGYDSKPFAEDMFKESPPADFKLKFKASGADADQKSGTLYEDFSDSDDDFKVTGKTDSNVESESRQGLAVQSMPGTSAFGNEGLLQQVTGNKTADDLDWEFHTEEFIRKLQQPRQPQRTVTVVPKSESSGRIVALPAAQNERIDDFTAETQSDNLKLAKSFVPLEELRTIRKTIIVSESAGKTESGMGKSDSTSSAKNLKKSYAGSSNAEKSPKLQQRNEGSSKSAQKTIADNSRNKKRGIEADKDDGMPTAGSKVTKLESNSFSAGKDRQKKIDALLRELENLKRQQNILMRRKKREKDAHKDPFLIENSKLQEEICNQITKLRKASQQAVGQDNNESRASDQSPSKNETETDRRSRARSVSKSARSASPEDTDNRQYRSKSTVRNTDSAADRQPRVKRIDMHYEYFDSGNHFCRCCNCFSINIFEHCQHLISSAHQQNVDPFDKPWLKLAVKAATKPPGPKGKVTSARIRGVEFLVSTQAFYCSLCDVFLGSCTCAETHCKSDEHNEKYAKYLDDNPYYERRLELEKSSSSAVTGKPLPASMQFQTSTSYSGVKDESLVAALEKAKVKVQEMVKRRDQELANIDSEPLFPTYKKSRVVPKSSGPLTENVSGRRLEDDSAATDDDSKKKSELAAADLDDGNHVGTNAEGVASTAESQKNDAKPPETNKAKKSLPFIGKLPFLKAARTAKQAAVEQSAADDKSKIEIKLTVSNAVVPPVNSEPTISSDAVSTSAQEQDVPKSLASMQASLMVNSSRDKRNSLDAFLSIGDPESGQCQAVPVLNVGPQTLSEFMSENQTNGTKTTPETAEASNTSSAISTDAGLANATQSGTDVVTVTSSSIDVKVAVTDQVMRDVQLSGAVPISSPSNKNQTDDASSCVTTMSVIQTKDSQLLSVPEPHNANVTGIVAATGTNCNTDPDDTLKDHDDTSAMSLDIDDNTEDYEPQNNAETKQAAQIPRDEETAQLLPQISAAWMQLAASVTDDGDEEGAMLCDDFEILDECDADD